MRLRTILLEEQGQILAGFVARVKAMHVPEEAARESLILDGVPGFLEELAHDLEDPGRPEDATPRSRSDEAAGRHGEDRFDLGIDIATVAREWSVLRDVILERLIEATDRIDPIEYQVLSRHLSSATNASIARYAAVSEAVRRQLAAEHAGFLVHDLRNQVQGAAVALELLERGSTGRATALECLTESLFGLRSVLDRELARVRLDALSSGTPAPKTPIVVTDLLQAVLREVRPLALSRDVELGLVTDTTHTIVGDPRLLHSAFANLIGNAVKFTHDHTRVTVRVDRAGAGFTVDISDHCGGIAPELVDQLFTAHLHGARRESGFGLGLAIVRQTIELHGGRVTVDNRPGVGCCFRVALPVETAAHDKPAAT